MNKLTFKLPTVLALLAISVAGAAAQTNRLLDSPTVSKTANWISDGEAAVEEINSKRVFVIRNKGSFSQNVNLSMSDVGKFALFIGRGSSERVNIPVNGNYIITGLPYLYGYMLDAKESGRIIEPIQGHRMLLSPRAKDEWSTMYGIFRIPEGTGSIRFFMNQAERKDYPQDGSAARFADPGLYLFETEKDAREFAKAFKTRHGDQYGFEDFR